MHIDLVESSYCLLTEGNKSFYKTKVARGGGEEGGGTRQQVHPITEG